LSKKEYKFVCKMSLQECLASRKDCSGNGRILSKKDILEICESSNQAAPLKALFVVLPEGNDYSGAIYKYEKGELVLISGEIKTKYSMELYPELISKELIPLNELVKVGSVWQYLSLKVGSIGLGVSQRARVPKAINKIVNEKLNQNHIFVYSVAVRERDRGDLIEDKAEPPVIEIQEDQYVLFTPSCYEGHKLYKHQYEGTPLENAIFNKTNKKVPDYTTLQEVSQLLWACEGENDHATHGNRDVLEKNGYGRVHASGCAGYAVYPIVIIEDLAQLPKGSYLYNPVGYSALNRWINVDKNVKYDHFLQKYSSDLDVSQFESEFGLKLGHFAILLCMDRKKPCSGAFHKLFKLKYWAEIEVGMALAGLQLQANALGFKWQEHVISNPDEFKYRNLFHLDMAENAVNEMANDLIHLAKNERLSLKGNLIPAVLFTLQG
jgi:hypothetical protein